MTISGIGQAARSAATTIETAARSAVPHGPVPQPRSLPKGPLILAGIGAAMIGVGIYVMTHARDGNDGDGRSDASSAPPPQPVDPSGPVTPVTNAPFALETVATGLSNPVHIASAPGDQRLFVVQQGGQIVAIDGDRRTTFLDISSRISAGGERGLLSVAFHPDYDSNGRFFVDYTDPTGSLTVAEYAAHDGVADPDSGRVLLSIPHPVNSNHNGGQLAFDANGNLLIGTGDGGGGGDAPGNAQNPSVLLGKILRIDVDHADARRGTPYSIPQGNATLGRPEIFASGVRNPWRFSVDAKTGDVYIGDVGQNQWEEIDYIPAGTSGGVNLGWDVLEGTHSFEDKPLTQGKLVDPIAEYQHPHGYAVTGGVVYRGQAIPELQGRYLYSDFAGGWIRDLRVEDGSATDEHEYEAPVQQVSSFGVGPDGEVYVASLSGSISKLVPPA